MLVMGMLEEAKVSVALTAFPKKVIPAFRDIRRRQVNNQRPFERLGSQGQLTTNCLVLGGESLYFAHESCGNWL